MKFSDILGFDKTFPAHIRCTTQKSVWIDFWATTASGYQKKKSQNFFPNFCFLCDFPSKNHRSGQKKNLWQIWNFFGFFDFLTILVGKRMENEFWWYFCLRKLPFFRQNTSKYGHLKIISAINLVLNRHFLQNKRMVEIYA